MKQSNRRPLFFAAIILVTVAVSVGVWLGTLKSKRSTDVATATATIAEGNEEAASGNAPDGDEMFTHRPDSDVSSEGLEGANDTGAPEADAEIVVTQSADLRSSNPTKRPTASPIPSFTPMTCDGTTFQCRTDRMGHNQPLGKSQAICSRQDLFVFGMDDGGNLLWKDCTSGLTRMYYSGGDGHIFLMKPDGKFVIEDDKGNLVWEKECTEDVTFYKGCLRNPYYDCPYLHLHKKRGNVVLNRIDPSRGWVASGINAVYDF